MTFSIYEESIGTAKRVLDSLSSFLSVAEKLPDSSTFVTARIYEDMRPLSFQVYQVTQMCERLAAKMTGREPVVYEEDLNDFAAMFERIKVVQKALNEAGVDVVNTRTDEVAKTDLGAGLNVDISCSGFIHGVAIPNIYFHLSIAYAILRKEGVPLGKRDYITSFVMPCLPGAKI